MKKGIETTRKDGQVILNDNGIYVDRVVTDNPADEFVNYLAGLEDRIEKLEKELNDLKHQNSAKRFMEELNKSLSERGD
ncbi:hypothetical protein [Bacillus sp. T33-2]|uniref:hypothetical protein n=1 Tax=Bacillus sp. T33-2 TaxID=2054168 RepID=UPI000C759162|nr:hypothetical protein [Bacillus sp. T33-2]PLR99480.1 hypothetical protein CVD19_00015 [Bacillus sp. T33-2]